MSIALAICCTQSPNRPNLAVVAAMLQSHFAQTKRELPAGTPHKELMSRLAADYKLHKASAQQQQQQPPASQQPADLQPVWQQQQQLGEVLVEDTRVEVVELSDSEDEAGGSDSQPLPQQQQQATWDERDDQEDVGGLLSFLQRLDLAGAD
jgi:DNA primase